MGKSNLEIISKVKFKYILIFKTYTSLSLSCHSTVHWFETRGKQEASVEMVRETSVSFILPPPG